MNEPFEPTNQPKRAKRGQVKRFYPEKLKVQRMIIRKRKRAYPDRIKTAAGVGKKSDRTKWREVPKILAKMHNFNVKICASFYLFICKFFIKVCRYI